MANNTIDDPRKQFFKLHIRTIRERMHLSVEEAAKRSGISKISWAKYEGGHHQPGLVSMIMMCTGLGLSSLDDLVTFDREKLKICIETGKAPPVEEKPPALAATIVEVPPVAVGEVNG